MKLFLIFVALFCIAEEFASRHLERDTPEWGSYPQEALLQKIDGNVILDMSVDRNGNIHNINVRHSDSEVLTKIVRKIMKGRRFSENKFQSKRTLVIISFAFEFAIGSQEQHQRTVYDYYQNTVEYFSPPPPINLQQTFTSFK